MFAPVGALLPAALLSVRRGGRVVCCALHTSDIPAFPFELLTYERQLLAATNFTRREAHEFLALARHFHLSVDTTVFPLERANEALDMLRADVPQGTPVVVP